MTLFINSCVREESRTLILAKHLLKKLGGEYDEQRDFSSDKDYLRVEAAKEKAREEK